MAIFRITSRTRRADLAKRSLRYIVHRRSREQPTITRTLYDQYGATDKYQAYNRIDKRGEWATCFRTVISPDPLVEDAKRDLDLRALTDATMQVLRLRLKDKAFQYFAAIHTDHTNNRHIHVLLLLKQHRLSKADLTALRTAATDNAKAQRASLDKTQEAAQVRGQGQAVATAQILFRSKVHRQQREAEDTTQRSGGATPQNPTCASCGWTQEMRRLTKTLFHCTSCGRIVAHQGRGMTVVREPALTLFKGLEVGAV